MRYNDADAFPLPYPRSEMKKPKGARKTLAFVLLEDVIKIVWWSSVTKGNRLENIAADAAAMAEASEAPIAKKRAAGAKPAASAPAPGKRVRLAQVCTKCGQPRKGHKCTAAAE